MSRVAVIGLGYVGLTTSLALAELGHEVAGYDIDSERLLQLSSGMSPIFEPGLEALLKKSLSSEKVAFSSMIEDALTRAEFIFICVPTPQSEDGSADTSFVLSAVRGIREFVKPDSIVITKSTVPVGTARQVIEVLGRSDVEVASNPEFLREGSALEDFFSPDRIVVGALKSEVTERVLGLYDSISCPKISVSLESSELIKHASNTFLAMKLAFINDVAFLCEQVSANIDEVALGIGSDTRIGSKFLKSGPGWGGSCFPKDTKALEKIASDLGVGMPLITAAIESNAQAHSRVVRRVTELAGGSLLNATIGVWGIAFKANTDDTRSSPALAIIQELASFGANVQAYDPVAKLEEKPGIKQVYSAEAATKNADVLVLLTEWQEFSSADPESIAQTMTGSAVLDTRRVLDPVFWAKNFKKFEMLGGSAHPLT